MVHRGRGVKQWRQGLPSRCTGSGAVLRRLIPIRADSLAPERRRSLLAERGNRLRDVPGGERRLDVRQLVAKLDGERRVGTLYEETLGERECDRWTLGERGCVAVGRFRKHLGAKNATGEPDPLTLLRQDVPAGEK